MDTMILFKLFVMLFITYCVVDFFLVDLFKEYRKSDFSKFTLISLLLCSMIC